MSGLRRPAFATSTWRTDGDAPPVKRSAATSPDGRFGPTMRRCSSLVSAVTFGPNAISVSTTSADGASNVVRPAPGAHEPQSKPPTMEVGEPTTTRSRNVSAQVRISARPPFRAMAKPMALVTVLLGFAESQPSLSSSPFDDT